jgi:hypothetical protein
MSETPNTVDCDVCILGAGIAGLNALYAVSRHLSAGAKVVLVDRHAGVAGMWRTTYEYVRLHQPHPMFTVGNLRWLNQSDPYHLATRREVVEHLQYCFEQLSGRAQLETFFGYSYISHDDQPTTTTVTVDCRRDADGAALRIRARRLIKAFGYNIAQLTPLQLSSREVLSLAPEGAELLQQIAATRSTAPIYIVGGGKTGMDTAHMLIKALPGRQVRMLIGDGTMFLDRDKAVPGRWRKHFAGSSGLETFLDVARRFDGRNEVQVSDYMRQNYCVSLDATCRRFMFGLMSPAENHTISRGLDEVIRDHLVDVVDETTGPTLLFRSGRRRPLSPGSIFLNCTGYLGVDQPYEPYLSASGRVLSIQPSSTVHFLTSQAAYLLAHLFMMGILPDVPLYETEIAQLRNTSRDVFSPAAITLTLSNTAKMLGFLPRWVHAENGLDLTALFPAHRRMRGLAKLLLFKKLHPTQLTDALDVVRERFDVRLGTLRHPPVVAPTAAAHAAAVSAE